MSADTTMGIKIDERFLTGSMYAPFCRTMHAPMEEWDKDMQIMAKLGYNCLHGFASGTISNMKRVALISQK